MQAEQIIKTDRLGRMTTSRARREELLAEYDRSGMSGCEFAKWVGMKYSTLASWLQKRRLERENGVKGTPKLEQPKIEWVEAVLEKEAPKPDRVPKPRILVVHGPGGVRLELDAEEHVLWAAKLLRLLEQPC